MNFVALRGCVPDDEIQRNTALARERGLPSIERAGHVALVGGGPSVADHLEELREWDGPIWAINQTFNWLKERGIKSTFLTLDPKDQPWLSVERGDSALVALHCCPAILDRLQAASVTTYEWGKQVEYGCTTATAALHLAPLLGHRKLSLFGCDSSFLEATHAYRDDAPKDEIMVACGGEIFRTRPEMLLQAECIAAVVTQMGHYFVNRSGGLLTALIANPERTIVAISQHILESAA